MHVTAVCPFCQTRYQVQPALRGHPIRCPNPGCRKIFAVPSDLPLSDDPAARVRGGRGGSPPENERRAGAVGDMVPIVPTEPAASPPRPTDGDWWQTPPPVRKEPAGPAAPPAAAPASGEATWWSDPAPTQQRQRRKPAETLPMPPSKPAKEREPETQALADEPPEQAEQPRELPPGEWEAPPIRRGVAEDDAEKPSEDDADATAPRLSRRRAWRIILVIVVVVGGILGVGGWLTYQAIHKTEDVFVNEAKSEYEHGKYGSAANLYHNLAEKFSTSEHADEYRFLEPWCNLCAELADEPPMLGLEKLETFLKEHKKDPVLKQFAPDTGRQLLKLTQAFAERNSGPRDDKPLATLKRVEELRQTIARLGPEALPKADIGKIDDALGKVRLGVERWREHREVLDQLQRKGSEAPIAALKRGRLLLERKERETPGYGKDAEFEAAMAALYDEHLASVIWEPAAAAAKAKPTPAVDDASSLWFTPLLPSAAPGGAPDNDRVVLALVRGVLYALKQSNGELLWLTRVGIDTTVLPEKVPATSAANPERLLVLSADRQTMTAHATDGRVLWEYAIGQPVLGRPVVINQRAYLSAYDGWVHEIELSGGRLIGRYHLGQPLTRGGTREGETSRIYFPADDTCIYVLDVAERRCVSILYDGHPSGSLRSEPLIIPSGGEGAPGYCILNQTNGLDNMRLRAFELPLRDRNAAPVPLDPPPQIAGWTWFDPRQDGEKLATVSDAGILGLFGIRQVGNRDQALFPLLQPAGVDLSPFLGASRSRARERGRAQLVQMRGEDLWVLAHGRLQKIQLRWSNESGPRAVPGWEVTRDLGSPLHAAQRLEDRDGRATFFLVTQKLDRQICLASAVDEDGRILWQRQLGLVCQGEPLVLTPPKGGPPLHVFLDQGGGLFVLDPPHPPEKSRPSESIAPALSDNPQVPPVLVAAPDGHTAYEIAAPGAGKNLLVRHIEWVGEERRLRIKAREVPLLSAAGEVLAVPAGTPIVAGGHLIVPMADGNLARLPLPLADDKPRFDFGGPSWRSPKAPLQATAHLVALGGDRFLGSDGRTGLAIWEWPKDRAWQALPEGRDSPSIELPQRIAAPPLLLPGKNGAAPRLVVADADGVVHLLTVAADGAMQEIARQWQFKGRVTGGPFACATSEGTRIGCIVEGDQLAWLDPEKEGPLWMYRSSSDALIGQAQVVEDVLTLALQSGRYVALDPRTGQAKGGGYTLRASAAPASSPVPFGAGQLLAPLSDGTALLLSLKQLTRPSRERTGTGKSPAP